MATLFVAGVLTFAGCDNYDRTEVDYAIFVNRQSVTLFVGEQTQLVASPDDGGTFSWYTDDPEVATVEAGLITAVGAGSTDIIAERDGMSFRVEVTVQEGKFHQVKRMCAAVGLSVRALRRHTIGGLRLDETLRPGEFRPLKEEEREFPFMNK